MSVDKLQIRTVKLHEGPLDGQNAIVSHFTAIVSTWLYVWDGDQDRNHFVFAPSLTGRFTPSESAEFKEANAWLDDVYANKAREQPKVRFWILNLAIALRQYGTDYSTLPGGRAEPGPADTKSPPEQDRPR
jgi:hypothetical protein